MNPEDNTARILGDLEQTVEENTSKPDLKVIKGGQIRTPKKEQHYTFNTLYDGTIKGSKSKVERALKRRITDAYRELQQYVAMNPDKVVNGNPASINNYERPRARLTHLVGNLATLHGYQKLPTLAEYGGLGTNLNNIVKKCHKMGYVRR